MSRKISSSDLAEHGWILGLQLKHNEAVLEGVTQNDGDLKAECDDLAKEAKLMSKILLKDVESLTSQVSQLSEKSTLETPKLHNEIEPSQAPSNGKRRAELDELKARLAKINCIDKDKPPTMPDKMEQNANRMPLQQAKINILKEEIIDASTVKMNKKIKTQNNLQVIEGSTVAPVIPRMLIPVQNTLKKPATKAIPIGRPGPSAPTNQQGGSMAYHSNASNPNNNYQVCKNLY